MNVVRTADTGVLRRKLELAKQHKDCIDSVQSRSCHLTNAPRPRHDLSGAKHDKRVRVVRNQSKKKAEIRQVVRIEENLTAHLGMSPEANLEESRKATSVLLVVTQEELVSFASLVACDGQHVYGRHQER